MRQLLTFDDVALVPQYNNIASRTEPDLSSWITSKTKIDIPIIPANMDTVISYPLVDVLREYGVTPIIHRFMEYGDKRQWIIDYGQTVYMSCGCKKEDIEEIFKLYDETRGDSFRGVCFDVAHGHSKIMIDAIKRFKDGLPDKEVIAGNVCTAMAYHDLAVAGADAIKVGIGPGCFASDTRILMANGMYQNIQDIKIGDSVINCYGNPVKVIGIKNSGFRNIASMRVNNFHREILATEDHNFLIAECSDLSESTFQSGRIKKIIHQGVGKGIGRSKFNERIIWQQFSELNNQSILLCPKKYNWELPNHFVFDLKDYSIKKTLFEQNNYKILKDSYELGYIFGTFLGDGTSRISLNKKANTSSGHISWYFGSHEMHIVDKLISCLRSAIAGTISEKIHIKIQTNKIVVAVYCKPLAHLLYEFGKRREKHLPRKYYCKNIKYIKGIYDGLIDSDGHISNNGRQSFKNTSTKLIELLYFCAFTLGKTFSSKTSMGSCGGFKNSLDSVYADAHSVRFHKNPYYSQSKNKNEVEYAYQFCYYPIKKMYNYVQTWDIEVDCPTHSFIANNCIVHNSACTTRVVTGFGVPQFSAIRECAEIAEKLRTPLIADGGIRNSRDIVLALAAGASSVMVGKLFALTEESAAEKRKVVLLKDTRNKVVEINKDRYEEPEEEKRSNTIIEAKYRGQASEDFQNEFYGGLKDKTVAEGVDFWAPVSGSVRKLLDELLGGIRSGMTYGGARTIKELQHKAEFIQVTLNYMSESKPRC